MCPQRTTGWTWRKWRSCGNDTGPKLIIAGWSAYPRHLDFAEFRRIADDQARTQAGKLIDELWPSDPPSTVKTIVQTYVYQLRKLFGERLRSANGATLRTTRPGGYLLTVPPGNVDMFQFQELMGRGRAALRHGRPDHAVSARIDADLTNSRHGELVGELRRLVASHRLHEPFHIRLMQALHRSGRRGEALNVYHQLRAILDQDLGLEPSGEARQMHCEILNSD